MPLVYRHQRRLMSLLNPWLLRPCTVYNSGTADRYKATMGQIHTFTPTRVHIDISDGGCPDFLVGARPVMVAARLAGGYPCYGSSPSGIRTVENLPSRQILIIFMQKYKETCFEVKLINKAVFGLV